MTRRGDDLALEMADGETVPILEEHIELAAIARNIDCVENGAEDLLHLLDALTDRHPGAGLELDIGGAREMIGMNMGFENELDGETFCAGPGENGIGGCGIGLA